MSTPFPGADGADALQGFGQQWPMRSAAMMIAGGLEGCGPSQPPIADVNTISRRRRSGRPPGLWPAMAHAFRGNDDRWRLGGLRSLAAADSRCQHHFPAPTERTPSRGWPAMESMGSASTDVCHRNRNALYIYL